MLVCARFILHSPRKERYHVSDTKRVMGICIMILLGYSALSHCHITWIRLHITVCSKSYHGCHPFVVDLDEYYHSNSDNFKQWEWQMKIVQLTFNQIYIFFRSVNNVSNIKIVRFFTERALWSLHGMVCTDCNMYNMHISEQFLSSLN